MIQAPLSTDAGGYVDDLRPLEILSMEEEGGPSRSSRIPFWEGDGLSKASNKWG
mgnify:CR=1 FL=1